MSLHPRRRTLRRIRTSWRMILWLTAVWVLLWGDLTVANVLGGLAVALGSAVLLPLPPAIMHGRFRPLAFLRLAARFSTDLFIASFQVAWLALRPKRVPQGAVLRVQLRSRSDLYQTITSQITTLVPGSVVIEAQRLTRTLYIHVLDVETAGGIETFRQAVLDSEERVVRALGSDAELADLGLTPRRPSRTARRERHTPERHTPEVGP